MVDINFSEMELNFLNIGKEDLSEVLDWYNHTSDYMFGTGIDKHLSLKDLNDKYLETVISKNEFFAWIVNSESVKVGIIKGSIKSQNNNAIWINSLLIKPEYRRKGYGTEAVEMLIEHIAKFQNVTCVLVSVIEDNISGVRFWENMGLRKIKILKNHIMLEGIQRNILIMHKNI